MRGPWLALLVTACAPAAAEAQPPYPSPAIAMTAPTSEPAPNPIPERVVSRRNYRLSFAGYALEVDPTDGGRIVALTLDGRSVVLTRDEFPLAYGSSFWPSPQSDWNWPPPVEMDAAAWDAQVRGNTLMLTSGTNLDLGLSATQRITADPAREAFAIEFTLTNRGTSPRGVAPWQNTRVRPRGLTFFPANTGSIGESKLMLEPKNGVVWFQHDPASIPDSQKAFVDGEEGWLAQLDGDLLFLKVFPPVPADRAAPGEAEIEIYVDGKAHFVEMEQQGPYDVLAPGESSHWQVQWLVRRVPHTVVAEPESASLLAWVRELAAAVRR